LLLMLQATILDCLFFDLFPFSDNVFVSSEVDIRWCDVAQTFVVTMVIVILDECLDLLFKVAGQIIFFQKDAVFHGLVPSLDFTPKILLAHHLKTLKLPTFLREHEKVARQCAAEGLDHVQLLSRLVELELIDRERRMVERRIKAAKFPATKSLDSFDFKAIPKLNKMQVLELARCEWIERRENVIALGPSGTGKTHIALGLGLAACQKGMSVSFTTAAALVNELMEARDERRLLRLQKQMAAVKLLIIDELGFVPLSKTGAELLFEMISQRYERGATLITSNLPFDEWTETFGTERLTGALLDRLTHHVNILEMNGESYRLAQSRARKTGDNT